MKSAKPATRAVFVVRFGPPGVLSVRSVTPPSPGAGEVLIRTSAISVNFGDVQRRRGPYPGGQTPPFIPGIEAAGTIAEVGEGVPRVRVGERVVAYATSGAYADFVLARSQLAFRIPASVSDDAAAASLTTGVTAYELVKVIARVRPEQSVAIMSAAGGVGLMLVQLARMVGAKPIFGAVGSAEKVKTALDAGCDEVVNYESSNLTEAIAMLAPKGIDVVFDSVGATTLPHSVRLMAPFGKLVSFGQSSGSAGSLDLIDLFPHNHSVLGYNLSQVRNLRPRRIVSAAHHVLDLVSDGKLVPLIHSRYPLESAAKAHFDLESRQAIGKILLVP